MMIHWFKKHPDYLFSECRDLSHNSNYKELFQKRDERLVSHGYVVVRLDKVYKFPILLVYPPAVPYVLPLVFPLKRELTEGEVEQIAKSYNALPPKESQELFYQYRHQNGTGALCIIEWEGFNEEAQFFGISSIIERVRDWYKGHVTGEFLPDSEEVAFVAHFNNISNKIHLFYSEDFVSNTNIEGEFYATQYFDILKGVTDHSQTIFLGSYISGIKESGLETDAPVNLNVREYLVAEGLRTSLDLKAKPDRVKYLVEQNKLKVGLWFDIQDEPSPFRNFSELVKIIGNGDFLNGQARLARVALSSMKLLPQEILIAIRFPNRARQKEFQVFIVHKIEHPNGLPLFVEPIETMSVLISNYDFVEAVVCEKFSEETFFQRNAQRADRQKLKNETINVLGVGALGSEIADSLSKAGVGQMVLVDNQTINVHNIIRHLVGSRYIDIYKVEATKACIEEHNPFIKVETIPASVTSFDLASTLPILSTTISSIADDNIESFVNEQMVIVNKPVFYVRALRGGKVARIVRVIPGTDACLNCLRLYRKEESEFINIPVDP